MMLNLYLSILLELARRAKLLRGSILARCRRSGGSTRASAESRCPHGDSEPASPPGRRSEGLRLEASILDAKRDHRPSIFHVFGVGAQPFAGTGEEAARVGSGARSEFTTAC